MLPRSSVSISRLRWLIAWCGFLFASALPAPAAELAVSAQLSRSATGVGEPVQLQIKVTGARSAGQPPAVDVDGLRVSYLGPSQSSSVRIENGNVVSETSVTYVYQVEPMRTGDFTIPAVAVPVDGRTLKTHPVALKVEKGGGRSNGEEPPLGALEVVIPKKTVYVGEMVPVEIRLSVDSRVHWQPEAMPQIPGEGFTKQKLPEPRQERGTKDGRDMDVLVFRTAITPSKAGKITLGPVEIPYIAQVPRAQRNRPRSFFDDVFGDPFFAVNQRFKAQAAAVELEVKPLPAAGRPESFSGAVGQFKFSAAGSPNRVKLGDPVTMKLTVTGQGNFDRIGEPALRDAAGWRSYPASSDFKAEDELGLKGTKTFSVAVIPEDLKTAMPVFEFAYFDPATGKYVLLTSEPEKLAVEGVVPPPPVVVAPAPTRTAEPPAASPAPAQDILGIRYDAGRGRHSFEPLYARPAFLLAQAVPVAILAAMLFVNLRRKDADAKRVAALKRQKADLLAVLRGRELSDEQLLDTAAQVIQVDTALVTDRPAGSIDAAIAQASRHLDAETADGVERIFNARAELLYAGMGGRGAGLSADERQSVLRTVENFERSRARA
jgi:hypothetical protein